MTDQKTLNNLVQLRSKMGVAPKTQAPAEAPGGSFVDKINKHLNTAKSLSMLPSEEIDKNMQHPSEYHRAQVAEHAPLSDAQVLSAMADKHPMVRAAAIKGLGAKAQEHHLSLAMNDPDSDVKMAALMNPNSTHEHITKGLMDKDREVKRVAAFSHKLLPEHLDMAIKDPDLTAIVMQHPSTKPEHIQMGLRHTDPYVREVAKKAVQRMKGKK